jgi:uncharacterized protein (DUF169 family)
LRGKVAKTGETVDSLGKIGKAIEDRLRLRTRIIGFQRLWSRKDLEAIPNTEKMGHYSYFCQLPTYCRTKGVPIGATIDDVMPSCSAFIGLREIPPEGQDGTIYMATWVTTREDAKRRLESIPKIPVDGHEAILLSPLSVKFDPDVILVYGTPAQMQFIINAIQLTDYEVLQFYSVGESACTDSLVRCYLTGKPHLAIPCYGERRLGHVAEDELVFAIPPNMMQKIADNLAELFRRGLTYPIKSLGMNTDPLPHQNTAYRNTWFNPLRK